ncbi:hypothetical protein GGF46_002626 [Coemansia sp. RSA 552]|nr:hypothetical protein GGF46_002626 [Coemansia sp. RSA 552]
MDSFLRNHILYLLCGLLGALASKVLAIVDGISNCWHATVCMVLSLLPKARVVFPVCRPAEGFHPAVLITGTSSGIGHDTAVALASYGYTVFAGVRSWEDGTRVEKDFRDAISPENIRRNPWARATVRSTSRRASRAAPAESAASADGRGSAAGMTNGAQHDSRIVRQRRARRALKMQPSPSSTEKPVEDSAPMDCGEIVPVILDVASSESVDRAFEQVAQELRSRQTPLVAVVNNAGVTAFGPMDMSAPEFIDHAMDVNFRGPVRVAQRFMPLLRVGSGRIVNISSVMSWLVGPGFGVYCASKAALSAASRSWRYELAGSGISVSVLEPGITRTALWSKVEAQLEFHHARLHGFRPSLRPRTSMPAAMPGDEAVASAPATPGHDDGSTSDDPAADAPAGSDRDRERYGSLIRQLKSANELTPIFALPTRHAIAATIHALTSRYPKATYRVGWDARLMSLVTWVASEEVVEWLCRAIGFVSET